MSRGFGNPREITGWLQIEKEISEAEEKLLDMFSELVPSDTSNIEKMNRAKELLTAIVK